MIKEQRTNSGQFTEGNEFAWSPGQSGNPDGRPKDSLTTLLREYLDANNQREKQLIIGELVSLAKATGVQGQIAALREIFDRIDGKVSQDIKLEGIVGVLTPQYLELARNRLLEAKERTKELIEGHKDPQVLENETK